ncbi:MAG: rhodanese-like domain-containing protein [Lutispora sp.]
MKRKFALLLAVTMLLSLLFTGCSPKEQPAPQPEAPAQETTPAPVEKVPYIHDDLLVDADWLNTNLSNVIVIDARKDAEYNKGHIAGSINMPWQPFTDMEAKKPGDKGWGTLLAPEKLSAVIGGLGIDGSKTVVVYAVAPGGWGDEGRVAWTLKSAGIKDVKVLNGGFASWEAKGYTVNKDAVKPAPADLKIAAMDETLNVTTDYLKANLDKVKIIDTRDADEYEGAVKFGEARGGHIPNAINITWTKLFNDDGTVKDQKTLEELLTSYGITKNDEIVSYCTKGIRSAYMTLILKMSGYENAKNYDSSYYEWAGNKELEVVGK